MTIVCMSGKITVRDVHTSLSRREPRYDKVWIGNTLVVTSVAGDLQGTGRFTENMGTVKGHVSEGDENSLAFINTTLRHVQDLAGTR